MPLIAPGARSAARTADKIHFWTNELDCAFIYGLTCSGASSMDIVPEAV